MKAHTDKTPENTKRSTVNGSAQIKSGAAPVMRLSDNRAETVMQVKLQEMANNSVPAKHAAQLSAILNPPIVQPPIQKRENHTGLPDNLKSGIENLSGYSMDDVKVHYHSAKPAQLQAHAYAQGADIHIAAGQENHLPHEAWHVVQQKQGRVKPTIQAKGIAINDDKGLEREADMMGEKASKINISSGFDRKIESEGLIHGSNIVQAKKTAPFDVNKKYPQKFKISYGEYSKLDHQEYVNLMYNKLETSYNANLDKGRLYWNKLKNALADFKSEDNDEFLKTQDKKHFDYDFKFNKNYGSKTKNLQDSKNVEISSRGLAADGDEVDLNKTPYTNQISFDDNSISAVHNYADKDFARKQDEEKKDEKGYEKRGLPNSEILWQQYKLAAESQFWFFKESRAKRRMKELSAIKRRQVQNPSTMMTILFALPDDKTSLEAAHVWDAESDEFLAMLGTPNCSGAVFMLTDHADELDGKSISEVKLLGGEEVNLDIKIG